MIELWLVNQYASTPRQPGHTRHFDFAVELNNLGFRTKVFASSINLATRGSVHQIQGLGREEIIEGTSFFWLKSSHYRKNDWRRFINMLSFGYSVYRAGTAQSPKPDIIVGSSPTLFAAAAAYFLARKLKARFVLELRDLWPQTFVDMGHFSQDHIIIKMLTALENFLYQKAEHIIVLAEGSRDYLLRRGIADSKISFIPNGVDLEHFSATMKRKDARKKYGFSKFTIVYTGAHGPANGLDVILEAAEQLKSVSGLQFVLVGDGTLKTELQTRAKKMDLTNVRFLSPVPKYEIPDLLLAADAAIISLTDSGVFGYAVSPNKLFDYLAAFKPVLCTVPGAVGRMVQENRCGYTSPPEDSHALAANVRKLLSLPARSLEKMGTNGNSLIRNKYSRKELAGKLRSDLIRLIDTPENN